MAKKVSIAISHALTVSITAPGGPVSLPHTVAPEDPDAEPPSLPHTLAPDNPDAEPPSLPHTLAPDFDPLSMVVNGPHEVGSLAHGLVAMELPGAQKVRRVEVKRHENGDLLITLLE